jgi:hypothetical protein
MGRRAGVLGIVLALAIAGLVGIGASPSPAATAPIGNVDTGPAIGSFDSITTRFGNPEGGAHSEWTLKGWAADRDALPGSSLGVDIWLNGQPFRPVATDRARPDVRRAHPWAPLNSGWQVTYSSKDFDETAIVCAYALNMPRGGPNTLIGCRDLLDPNPNDPMGTFEHAYVAPGQLRVIGWAGDRDGYRTTRVRVYYEDSDKPAVEIVADKPRADVQRAFPRLSSTTGFDVTLPIRPGPKAVCVLAQNTGPGGYHNADLGCRTGTAPGARAPGPHDPRGSIDKLVKAPGGGANWLAQGWAYDPDTGGPVQVRVRTLGVTLRLPYPYTPTYDRSLVTIPTGQPRADIGALFPAAGPNAGFSGHVMTTPRGRIRLACAYAVNVGPGSSRFIGCWSP